MKNDMLLHAYTYSLAYSPAAMPVNTGIQRDRFIRESAQYLGVQPGESQFKATKPDVNGYEGAQ